MGMSIYNNLTAMSALHENNRNEKSLAKMLKRAASGMKINSAGDDASGYAISEKMRVKLRALEQNDRNVKNGASMLRTASGAVQELMLSILVDTFYSRDSWTMLQAGENRSISVA